jgi:septum site-determining protein MinC
MNTTMQHVSPTTAGPAFELKGHLLTLMVLQLLDSDNAKIATQLSEKMAQAPHFFQQAPVVIDLKAMRNNAVDLHYLVNLLRTHGLMPVAVQGGSATHNEVALQLNLGLLTHTTRRSRDLESPSPPATTKVITQPVRSGQQIVSLQGDLVIVSPVSPGAEILAQRHIHVYGALRGRALAGVNGDEQARIFCQCLDAEIVSIAGQYQINEDLPDDLRGKPAQIYLEGDKLQIQPLL